MSDYPAGETTNNVSFGCLPLIFAINQRRRRHPGYITLDRALDQYGKMHFPNEWGVLQYWDQLPFLWAKEQSFFVRPRLRHSGFSKKKKIILDPIIAPKNDYDRLRHCADVYWQVCKHFRKHLEAKDLIIYGSVPVTAKKMKIKNRGVFSTQRINIFYTGTVSLNVTKGSIKRCRIYLGKRTFDHWFKPQVYGALAALLRLEIDTVANTEGFEITEKIWDSSVSPLFKKYKVGLLRSTMKTEVFRKLTKRKGRGRPDATDQQTYKENVDKLSDAVGRTIARFQAELKAKPRRSNGDPKIAATTTEGVEVPENPSYHSY